MRQTYHLGPVKIAMCAKRHHSIEISRSGVSRVLKRLVLSHLPSSQHYKRHECRWKGYEKQQPGYRVHIGVKFIVPLRGTGYRTHYYQCTAIDDCTRIRVLKTYRFLNQKTAIQFVDFVIATQPFAIDTSQTDNGSEIHNIFYWHILDKDINPV